MNLFTSQAFIFITHTLKLFRIKGARQFKPMIAFINEFVIELWMNAYIIIIGIGMYFCLYIYIYMCVCVCVHMYLYIHTHTWNFKLGALSLFSPNNVFPKYYHISSLDYLWRLNLTMFKRKKQILITWV